MEKAIKLRYEDLELAATLHYPADGRKNDESSPAVVICHGFTGTRIGVDRLFVKTARALADAGYYVLRFDYGGCGESTGDYGALGFASMIAQTRTALDYVLDICDVNPQRVTLLGHSLGGAVALHTAVKDKRVRNLVLWSAAFHPFNDIVRIVGRDVYDQVMMKGEADYAGYALKPVFFESLAEHQPFQAALKFAGDVLLVHGTSDDVIPTDYSFVMQKLLWTRNEGSCEKEILFQADHTYSTRRHQEEAIRKTIEWLQAMELRQLDWQHWSI